MIILFVICLVFILFYYDRWWSIFNIVNILDLLEVKFIEGKGLGVVVVNRIIRKNIRVMVDVLGLMIDYGVFIKLRMEMLVDLIYEVVSMLLYFLCECFFVLIGVEGLF